MRLLMVAPPGAGKGTQAERLASHYGIVHLSSGDILRAEVAAGSPVGQALAGYLERGELVPDELIIEMLTTPVLEAVGQGGYVLDGFPRTLGQAEEAYRVASQIEGVELQAVIHLEVPPDELRRRLLHRAGLEGRSDDNEVTIARRLAVYEEETKPMLRFYGGRGLVIDINGNQPVDVVFDEIVAAIEKVKAGLR
jgi:adenylate kinase